MSEQKLKALKTSNFQEHIGNGLVLVEFSSPTCNPCKMLEPQLAQLNSENNSIEVYKVNVFDHSELAQEYSVMSVPTVILFSNREIADQFTGFRPYEALVDWIKPYL